MAAGIGTYTGIAPALVRLAWVFFTLLGGSGVLAYLIAWAIISDEDSQHSFVPIVLLACAMLVPRALLLWIIPVRVLTTH